MTQALNLANFANNLNTAGATSNTGLQNSSVTVTAGTGMSGGGAVALGSSVTLTNTGVTSVAAGTGISVSASTGGVTITNSAPAVTKAWARFSGASGTINGSYNISSVVRNSTGQYTVNFTNAMANANYSVMSSASPNASGTVNGGLNVMFTSGGATLVTPTTSAFQFICYSVSVGNIDPNWVCIAVFD